MDNTKVYKELRKHTQIAIDHRHGQWVAAGSAVYNIDDLPEITENNLLPLIGVTTETAAKYTVKYLKIPIVEELATNSCEGDGCLLRSSLLFNGQIMLKGEGSNAPACVFCNAAELKVFGEDKEITYVYREIITNGKKQGLVIVHYGLLTLGAVLTSSINKGFGWPELAADLRIAADCIIKCVNESELSESHTEQISFDDSDSQEE